MTIERSLFTTSSVVNDPPNKSLFLVSVVKTILMKSYSSFIPLSLAHLCGLLDNSSRQQIKVVVIFLALPVVAGGIYTE